MSSTKWTKEQTEAIYTARAADGKGCNILVNAAAGSGKTAVLVERIIKKLIPNAYDPETIDVDRLLVVTFTNAAAAEMQKRVSDALTRELANAEPAVAEHLQKQITLVNHADITTIDAFCLKAVRNYFHLLDIDPGFAIAGEAELALMKDEAIEELFDALYEQKDPAFLRLADLYSDGKSDSGLTDLVFRIHLFIQSMPDPAGWLLDKCAMYQMEDVKENPWVQSMQKERKKLIRKCCDALMSALWMMAETCALGIPNEEALILYLKENPPGTGALAETWKTYYEAAYTEYFQFAAMLKMDWDETYLALQNFQRGSFNARGLAFREQAEEVKAQFELVHKKLLEPLKQLVSTTLQESADFLREEIYPVAMDLAHLVLQFDEKYREKKDKKNVLEFSDIEHLCLRLFLEQPDVAKVFRDKYIEILMDEYQDSNALQEAIFSAISRGDNFFMVGDMKQSIYRFRSGDPSIFKAKNDTYKKEDGAKNRKIVLSKNFRSRRAVLDGANAVFSRLMSEEAGEIAYDADQMLYLGDESYEQKNPDYRPVCVVIEGQTRHDDTQEDIEKIRIEARYTARKIREMKDNKFQVRDTLTAMELNPETGEVEAVKKTVYRDMQNRDIAILMSSYKDAAAIYIEQFMQYGIPCFAETGGYFERNEIKIMLSLVKVINNPSQDIPLLSVLRSPIGGFDDSELAQIRIADRGQFYAAFRACAKTEGGLADKCRTFLKKLAQWRQYAKYMSSDKLLWTLYEETGFYTFVGALDGGEDAQANLRLLFQRAKMFESSGYKGLFNFARYINRMRNKEKDLSAAGLVGEQHDIVRLMTIHKSKGLEFPVVFLANTGKQFYMRDDQGSVILHKDLGLGMDYINFAESYRMPTIAKSAVAAEIHRESISEEIRKLYVAMTRAKEKLFVTSVVAGRDASDPDKYAKSGLYQEEEKWCTMLPDEKAMFDPEQVLETKRYIDWIAPVARVCADWIYEPVTYDEAVSGAYVVAEEDTQKQAALADAMDLFAFTYPYDVPKDLPVKIAVTELKRRQLADSADAIELRPVPDFLAENKPLAPTAVGNALHTTMQKIPPVKDMDMAYIVEWIDKLTQNGDLTPEEADSVKPEKILTFYQSELGQRMLKSRQVWREQPFEILIPAEDAGFSCKEEKIILQGVIDCCFEEDDGLVLVDYKTDKYQDKWEILSKYTIQLDYYARAIRQILQKPVKNKYLYLFYGSDMVEWTE